MPGVSQALTHFIPSMSLQGKYYHQHFIGEETGFEGVKEIP